MSAAQVPVIGGPDHVQVPDDLPRVSDTALAVWVILTWRAGTTPWCNPSQERIQTDLGRPGHDPQHLTTVNAELGAAGMLDVRRTHVAGKTRNMYRPRRRARTGDGRRYVALPVSLLVALAAGEVGPEHIAAAVRWLRSCREAGGWVRESLGKLADGWGQSVSTARRHRSTLLRLGVLDERVQPGGKTLTAPAGCLPAERSTSTNTPVEAPAEPRSQIAEHPGHRSRNTPVTDRGQNYPDVDYPHLNYSSSPPLGGERTVRNAQGRTDAATPREKVSPPSDVAWQVLAALPRPWRECPAWVRQRMAAQIGRSIASGFPPDEVARAVREYAPDPLSTVFTGASDKTANRHIRAFRHVLGLLAGERVRGYDPMTIPATPAPEWLTLDPATCIACDQPGATQRPELPLAHASSVCDDCWPTIAADLTTPERTAA